MKKTILVHGAVIGSLVIGTCVLGLVVGGSDEVDPSSAWLGYLIMLLAFALIFPAVKRWRDREGGGVIGFRQALLLGLGITAVASVIYVVGWEVYLAATDHRFIHAYAEAAVAAQEEAGVVGAELQALKAQMSDMVASYRNPLFRIPITFTEVLPVGLMVSVLAALVLRRSDVLPDAEPALAGGA